MSGISKLVDDRIEQIKRERVELDALRKELDEREAALVQRESAPPPPVPEAALPIITVQTDIIKLRAELLTELAALEEQKIFLLEGLQREIELLKEKKVAQQIEDAKELAQLRVSKMEEVEKELEVYRQRCFENLKTDLQRQRELNAQRAATVLADDGKRATRSRPRKAADDADE